MAARFEPKIKRKRFAVPGYTPQAMADFAGSLEAGIKARWDRGEDVNDASAPTLSVAYGRRKQRRGLNPIRDLNFTGRTRRGGLRVLRADSNRAVLGPIDAVAALRLRFNQRRSRQYGVSARNREELLKGIHDSPHKPVEVIDGR